MTRGVPDSRTPVAETQSAASVVEAKVEPQIEKPVKVITELPETAVNGRIWLKGLPEDSFVLEHQVFDSIKEAQASIKGKEWLVNARIVPVYAESKDEAKFAVITGPFKSKDRAKNTIARLRLSNDVTIKSVPAALAQSGVKPTKP
jgi:cell division protein FtsN